MPSTNDTVRRRNVLVRLTKPAQHRDISFRDCLIAQAELLALDVTKEVFGRGM